MAFSHPGPSSESISFALGTSSRWAAMSDAIRGTPMAMASTAGRSKPSTAEGATTPRDARISRDRAASGSSEA